MGAKLLTSTENVKTLVDAGLEYDPTGYGKAAWGVVSFGLTWAINVKDMREFVFENFDLIAQILERYLHYETLYREGLPFAGSPIRTRLEEAMIDVYCALYNYIISTMQYLVRGSIGLHSPVSDLQYLHN